MCDMATLGRMGVSAGTGALGGYTSAKTGMPNNSMNLAKGINNKLFPRRTMGAPSPTGAPNSTQAPQSTMGDPTMQGQPPGFGYRPQSLPGEEQDDWIKKRFGTVIGGGQGGGGFNA